MRVFIYEFVTGGGAWSSDAALPDSLLIEGQAMLRAVAADFAALDDVEVTTTRDVRLSRLSSTDVDVIPVASSDDERAAIARLAQAADWTLLIAPETDGLLLDRCRLVESAGGRLLSPSSAVIEIASSKQSTVQLLAKSGVQTPCGVLVTAADGQWPMSWQYPVVVKPNGACGSCDVWLINTPGDLQVITQRSPTDWLRVEEFVPGLAASVAVLCGPTGRHALSACEQVLSGDGRLRYCGGRLPLAPRLNSRGQQLALDAVATLPEPRGYMGVDLVLGDAKNGSGDYVIEINPRLTTSYVGLRALARTNLAAAMLSVACGEMPDLSFGDEQLEFTADGVVSPVLCSLYPDA